MLLIFLFKFIKLTYFQLKYLIMILSKTPLRISFFGGGNFSTQSKTKLYY